jgi:erythromycin esterase
MWEKNVINLLTEIRSKVENHKSDAKDVMSTEQNAVFVARNAEKYYRVIIKRGSASWNIRYEHMVSALERLMKCH